ncbi:hypothetical protein HRbin25_00658 [bacterium HR25]|jgi:hypothetical protein|nr:hypothetical protein HRbin25_00658 [bacterium HR25]
MERWLPLAAALCLLVAAACGGGGDGQDESVTVDGEVLTRKQFEQVKEMGAGVLDAMARQDWGDLYEHMDRDTRSVCSRQHFEGAWRDAFERVRQNLGDDWWEEPRALLIQAVAAIKAITWEEVKADPVRVQRRLDNLSRGLFGPSQDAGRQGVFEDVVYEDGKARLHKPHTCQGPPQT